MRRRLAELDLIDELSPRVPSIILQLGFGLFCFSVAFQAREFVDIFRPGAGPFSLTFPAIMLSTLYGRWQSGLVTFFLAFLHAWYFVLPSPQSFAFEDPADQARTMVNGSAALVILFFAEIFRAAVRRATHERDAELKTQEHLMRELEHRTKNNFAMVSSLLTMQERKSTSDDVRHALMTAAARVQSFAAIHETIYTSDKHETDIPLKRYLEPLIKQLEIGLFKGRPIQIELECPPASIPRERALAFGLIVNELVTNAAKHAFPDDRRGVITVAYIENPGEPWQLSIKDNGCGMNDASQETSNSGSGLGKALMVSFAITAGGKIGVEKPEVGSCVTITQDVDSRE